MDVRRTKKNGKVYTVVYDRLCNDLINVYNYEGKKGDSVKKEVLIYTDRGSVYVIPAQSQS